MGKPLSLGAGDPLGRDQGAAGASGALSAVRDGGCTDPGLLLDTNPPDDDSWWYKLFQVDRPDSAEIFRQPSGRAPEAENLPNLPPDYCANQMKGADEDYIRVYVDGLSLDWLDLRAVQPRASPSAPTSRIS